MSGESSSTQIRCEIAVLAPATGRVLIRVSPVKRTLPLVCIDRHDRPCEQIQTVFREQWKLSIHLVDVIWDEADEDHALWIAESLDVHIPSGFGAVAVDDLPGPDKPGNTKASLRAWIKNDSSHRAAARIGWIENARTWIEDATGDRLLPACNAKQYNGGGGFNLLRWTAESGRCYWLKSVADPNQHEFAVTSFICNMAPAVSPLLLATHCEWQAWLMLEDDACGAGVRPSCSAAVEALVHVQGRGMTEIQSLLDRGAFDQRAEHFEQDLPRLFDYLYESMQMQESTKAACLSKGELDRLQLCLLHTYRDSAKSFPITLLHGDLTGGNVSGDERHCRFLDWCESYIGPAPISLHHLLMLYRREGSSGAEVDRMTDLYLQRWDEEFGVRMDATALTVAPFLAVASALYGRGTWLQRPEERNRKQWRSYSRTLARHMAREAHSLRERGTLCQS